MEASTEEEVPIVSQAILVKKALAEGLKVHLRKRPFSKITVEDICAASGVSRRSFYRQFQDKYELLNWLYDYEFCRFADERDYHTIWDYYPDICCHLYSDRAFFVNAFSVTGQNSFRDFCNDKLYPILMRDFGYVFPDEATARFVIKRITDASFDGFQWWLGQEPCMPPEQYAAFSRRIFTDVARGIAEIDTRKKTQ